MDSVGILGGTFDPIHQGHLHIARVAMDFAGLNRVVFCPTSISPLKQDSPPAASGADRVAMVELAIQDEPRFELCNLEILRGGVSYTIDTIKKIPGNLRLILGEDVMASFENWRDWEKILQIAPPIVLCREGANMVDLGRFPGALRVEAPLVDVSSSMIRKKISEGSSCEGLLPPKVLDYIRENGLY